MRAPSLFYALRSRSCRGRVSSYVSLLFFSCTQHQENPTTNALSPSSILQLPFFSLAYVHFLRRAAFARQNRDFLRRLQPPENCSRPADLTQFRNTRTSCFDILRLCKKKTFENFANLLQLTASVFKSRLENCKLSMPPHLYPR